MVAADAGLDEGRRVGRFGADRTLIRTWLTIVAVLILAMVVVGGATRLTDSGLSITEWKPIHGAIPPLNAAEWQEEFAKYREIPEYDLVNKGMTVDEFKTIFWWEWAHRLLGRLIGVVVFVPLAFFWASGRLEPWLKPRLAVLFILGGLQGAVGWWMVVSGLADRVDVSQYRLATHLTFACIIFAYTVWLAGSLAPAKDPPMRGGWAKVTAFLLLGMVFVQIYLGGLVAGIKAGLIYNTWPLIDGALIPDGLLFESPAWRNFFENHLTVQFDHRMAGYLLFVLALLHLWATLRSYAGTAFSRRAIALAALVFVQATVGVLTLLHVVQLHLALTHQAGAVIVLWVATRQLQAATIGERGVGDGKVERLA